LESGAICFEARPIKCI